MNTNKQNQIASNKAESAFEKLFGKDADFSFGQLDERCAKEGAMVTSWEAECGKRYARCFLTVLADGSVPFDPVAY